MINQEQQLERTVTDGDLRRLLLQGGTLDSLLSTLAKKQPTFVYEGEPREKAFAIMDHATLDHIPVLNERLEPIDLLHRRDFLQRIFLSSPHLGGEEYQFVAEAFASNWIAPLGPNVDAFEKELASYLGVDDAAAVSSGTAALHLAMILSDVRAGDRCFVRRLPLLPAPTLSCISKRSRFLLILKPTAGICAPSSRKSLGRCKENPSHAQSGLCGQSLWPKRGLRAYFGTLPCLPCTGD